MPPADLPDFSDANGRQLGLLREAVVKTTSATGLDMLLSDAHSKSLDAIAGEGSLEERVFVVLNRARAEGWLNALVHSLLEKFPHAPALRKAVQTIPLIPSVEPAPPIGDQPGPSGKHPPVQNTILLGRNGYLEPFAFVEALDEMRNRICRVELGDRAFATGCLIAPDLVLTCHHNIAADTSAERLKTRFDYALAGADVRQGTAFAASPNWKVLSEPLLNGGLNFAVIRLASAAGHERMPDGEPRGWINLTRAPVEPADGDPIALLHHPSAGPMKMSLGAVVGRNQQRLEHSAPTEPGSSGAGCFNMKLQLIGLHEGKRDQDWRTSGLPARNVAIRIDAIIQRVRQLAPGLLPDAAT